MTVKLLFACFIFSALGCSSSGIKKTHTSYFENDTFATKPKDLKSFHPRTVYFENGDSAFVILVLNHTTGKDKIHVFTSFEKLFSGENPFVLRTDTENGLGYINGRTVVSFIRDWQAFIDAIMLHKSTE